MTRFVSSFGFFCSIMVCFSVVLVGCPNTCVLSSPSLDDDLIIYVTGFTPFYNFSVNPSEIVVNALHNKTLGDYRIIGRVLPVDFVEAPQIIQNDIQLLHPSLIVNLGLDADCTGITLELLSVNIMFEKRADYPLQTLHFIQKGGPLVIPTGLQVNEMYESLKQNNIPVSLSLSAGLYVCNTVFYQTLFYLSENQLTIPSGFIHLPLLSDGHQSGMEQDLMIEGIVTVLLSHIDD